MVHIPDDWRRAADRILASEGQRCLVMVVGLPDAGKSTFCVYLGRRLAEAGQQTGIVDADVGQSSIGPPTAISGGLAKPGLRSLSQVQPAASYFVGSTSPLGHLLPCVVGTARVCQRLQGRGAQAVVVDTSGLVAGSIGRTLKEHKADLLEPADIAVIQASQELEALVRLWERAGTAQVHRLRPSPAATVRSPEQRRQYRVRRLRDYFRDSRTISLPWNQVAFRGTALMQGKPLSPSALTELARRLSLALVHGEQQEGGLLLLTPRNLAREDFAAVRRLQDEVPIRLHSTQRYRNVLCGLLDGAGDLLCLAILEQVDFAQRALHLWMPNRSLDQVRIVQMGSLLLRPDGSELGTVRPGDL